jgi:hypothetical protein
MAVDPSDIELSPEQRKRLAELSEKTGKPWHTVFSEALASYRTPEDAAGTENTPEESFYDAAVRVGLLGSIDDAPPDLSTNRKHMEGFGQSGANSH